MKLQVNNSGAWKNVMEFPAAALLRVRQLVGDLGDISSENGYMATWRVQGDERPTDREPPIVAAWDFLRGWH